MSKITIKNNTAETLRVAIYKKPVAKPTLQTIAWQVVDPGPGGQCDVLIPATYQAFARYSEDPGNNQAPQYETNVVSFTEQTARFIVTPAVSQDSRGNGAVLKQSFEGLVLNEVRMVNNFGIGVWSHVQLDNDDIYAPQVLWPGGVRMEDIRASLYLAVVSQFVYKGQRLVDEEMSLTETEVLEGGTATVTGSMWSGYAISSL